MGDSDRKKRLEICDQQGDYEKKSLGTPHNLTIFGSEL
jgi:hypothetical protein